MVAATTAEVARYDKAQDVENWQDALAYANEFGGAEDWADVSGDWPVLEDKTRLVGVPFIIVGFAKRDGDNGEYTSLNVVTQSDERFIVNDGSTGIFRQIDALVKGRAERGVDPFIPLLVPGGLTRSDYYRHKAEGTIAKTLPDGAKASDWQRGTTFYLSA